MEENENDSPAGKPAEPERPTREQLRAHNRDARLSRGWAHKCACGRQFTTQGAYKRHVESYHGAKVTP